MGGAVISIPFRNCLGLNTQAAPEALTWDGQTGAWEAAQLINVDVLDGRRIRRRPGFSSVDARAWRDPFTGPDGRQYAVVDDVLSLILPDLSTYPLVALLTPGRVVWCSLDDVVFWTNSIERGLIQAGTPGPWGGKTWPIRDEADRFVPPPPGQVLGSFAGRVWIGEGTMLHFTEGAGFFHFYQDAASYFEMPGEVTMIQGVDNGLFAGTSAGVYFLAGLDPLQMQPRLVSDDPAILGSDVACRADDWGKFDPATAVLWTSSRGVCLGLQDGLVISLTKNRVALDVPAASGAPVLLPRRYVVVLHP